MPSQERDEDDQLRPCVICNEENEQMLMLSCVHDPCINCAAAHYVQNEPPNSKTYRCPICSLATELDTSSIIELQNLFAQNQKSRRRYTYKGPSTQSSKLAINESKQDTIKYEYTREPREPYDRREYGQRKESYIVDRIDRKEASTVDKGYSRNPTPLIKAPGKKIFPTVCNEHPQDELSYYCFSCFKLICPECAIHGAHHQHEVQATKRAIKEVKASIADFREQITQKINSVTKQKDSCKSALKQEIDRNKKYHDEVKAKFTVIRNALLEKQKDILKGIDASHERNCTQIKSKGGEVDSTIDLLHQMRKEMDNVTRKEDVPILQEYAQLEEDFKRLMEREEELVVAIKNIGGCSFKDINERVEDVRSTIESMEIVYHILN